MQSLTFLQFYEHCKCNYASNTHGQVHVHAGMAYKFNHDMHACFARNLATLNHCHIVAIGMTLFQLPKSLILEVLSIKHWRQSAFTETPLTVCHSRDARQRRASMLVCYNKPSESVALRETNAPRLALKVVQNSMGRQST